MCYNPTKFVKNELYMVERFHINGQKTWIPPLFYPTEEEIRG